MLETHDIEVESPDGFIEVLDFVDKGMHKQFVFVSTRGEIVRCSGGHLFETDIGWISAENISIYKTTVNVLHDDGKYYKSSVVESNLDIPIVDISVNHDNHRYYTNGVSSHNTGAGKTLVMCHQAAANLMFGKNVLYITMEMAEERIAERIDANLLDISLDDLSGMSLDTYQRKIQRLKDKTPGKLIIKEYPTGSANAGHIRYLLNDMKLKLDFVPDIVFIDYLNLCTSFRLKGAAASNSYTIIKSIAEELRGLAMEFDIPVVTATQANRSAYGNSDIDLTNTSECIFSDEKVEKRDGTLTKIKEVKPGDQIKSNDGYKTVMFAHHEKIKKCFKITTNSGKTIICSEDHVFPTDTGRISIKTGLEIGNKLSSN